MRRIFAIGILGVLSAVLLVVLSAVAAPTSAWASSNPHGSGRPSRSCRQVVSTKAVASPAIKVHWNNVATGPDGAWHRLVHISGSTWLQVFTTFPSSVRSQLNVVRSTDNARTWSPLSTVKAGARLVDNGVLFRTRTGEILLAGRNNALKSSYKISQWRSVDGGRTRARDRDIASAKKGLWEPSYYPLADGRLVTMWSDESNPGHSQVIAERVSANNGKTWGPKTIAAADGSRGRPGMASVAPTANCYLMAYEICATHGCAVFTKRSADGVTWPQGIGKRVNGHVCGPFLASLSRGRVMLTSCRVADGDNRIPISVSNDSGATWMHLAPSFSDADQYGFWPAIYVTRPHEVAAVSGNRIRFATVSITPSRNPTASNAPQPDLSRTRTCPSQTLRRSTQSTMHSPVQHRCVQPA